jgi:hypothetical protein
MLVGEVVMEAFVEGAFNTIVQDSSYMPDYRLYELTTVALC